MDHYKIRSSVPNQMFVALETLIARFMMFVVSLSEILISTDMRGVVYYSLCSQSHGTIKQYVTYWDD